MFRSIRRTIRCRTLISRAAIHRGSPTTFKHLYDFDDNNFAPASVSPGSRYKKESTVVKGSAGIFYPSPLLYNQFLSNGTQYPFRYVPTYTATKGNDISFGNPFPGGAPPCTTLIPSVAPRPTVPGSRLPGRLVPSGHSSALCHAIHSRVELGSRTRAHFFPRIGDNVFGSKGTRLPLSINQNQVNIANFPTGPAPVQANRPFAGYSTVNLQNTLLTPPISPCK